MTTIGAEEQVAALGHAVITTDPDGVILGWNPAAERLYGWAAEDVLGRNIAEVTVPDVSRETAEDIMRALHSGVPWSGGFPARRKDGSIFPALVTDTGIYRDGRLVAIIGISTNLGTALRPLLERSADAALLLRADTTITYSSPAVRLLFGWAEEELIGTSFLAHLHPDDRARLGVVLARVVNEPGPRPAQEVRVRRGTGWAWAEAAFTNFLDDPLVRGVVCNLRRSLAHDAEEEAEQRNERLEAALQSRLTLEQARGFLAGRDGISVHEALARMRGYATDHRMSLDEVADGLLGHVLEVGPPE
ncbi:PAS domain S-box protein [Nocardioides panaciterrulae]|uniref:PAS domain S-box-containing protein n=1 Tax=Nocardioides panaciterrulae TaxID=661492 RepID=A0A7Y9J999_9ACTN|nr:PAS domain S-box protein [Nocardioides panaciterrulae]NYD40372.1 PAS domain S-box-containing protein [Nocardioides panaciterrulae]